MLKSFSVLLLFVLAYSASATGFQRTADGCIKAGDTKFRLSVFRKNWVNVDQGQDGVMTFLGEGAETTKAGMKRLGKFNVTGDYSFDLTEIIDNRSEQELRIQYQLSASTPSSTQLFAYKTYLNLADYETNPIIVDGKPHLLNGKNQVSMDGKVICIPAKSGIVEISGARKRQVMLTREGRNLRVVYIFAYGDRKEAYLDMTMKFIPYETTPIDMSKAMNMGFKDETADDKKGGWTDQGADNDLAMMKSGRQEMNGITFDIIDPLRNNGKSCLAMAGTARPYFASDAVVAVPNITGRNLYILNGLAWPPGKGTSVGKVIIKYADETSSSHILKCDVDTGNFWNPRNLPNANVVWETQNQSAVIGLYASKIPLASKPVSSIEFISQNQVWMIVAASIGTAAEKRPEAETVTLKANADWLPFEWDYRIEKNSVADVSFLLDAPAGKYGTLKVAGDHFEFAKRPGVPVRFWGVNVCNRSMWHVDDKDAVAMLGNIAARGYNIVRLHHFDWGLFKDGEKNDIINPHVQKKMDFFISEAKKRGIYVTLDLYTVRNVLTEKYGKVQGTAYKVLCYIDSDVRADFIRRTRDMLSHVNPHTGLTWAEEPAVAMLNLINEGTLPSRLKTLPKKFMAVWEKALADYAERKGVVITSDNKLQLQDEFMTFIGKDFFDDLSREIRNIGGKMPLCDQNYADTTENMRTHYDYVDTHLYWCHPQAVGQTTWGLPIFVASGSPIAAYAGGVKDVFYARYAGKPMVISEWGFCYPNPHYLEGEIIMAAYSALQGYNGLMQFTYSDRQIKDDLNQHFDIFLTDNNPGHALGALAGSLMFLRGDVATAQQQVLVTAKSGAGLLLPLIVRTGLVSDFAPANAPLIVGANQKWDNTNHRQIRKTSDSGFISEVKNALGLSFDPVKKDGTVVSATKELFLNSKKRCFQAVTPCSEAAVIDKQDSLKGRFMRVKNGNTYATFFIGSLDGKPLAKSGRMAIIHLTDIKNAGIVFSDSSMTVVKNWGTSKLLLRRNIAEIGLETNSDYQLFACSANGKRLGEIPLKRQGKELVFNADNSAYGGVLLYELVKK